MFSENFHPHPSHSGWIEVITGSMFSGKTEELIRRLRRAALAKQKVLIFKPLIDTRYASDFVVSHDESRLQCIQVAAPSAILSEAADAQVVGIDEAQFFGPEVVDVCRRLADRGVRVVVAGLDMDFKGEPFGPMPALMAVAEDVSKVHAICQECGGLALFSHRISPDDSLILLGEKDRYEPLCRSCFSRKVRLAKVNNPD